MYKIQHAHRVVSEARQRSYLTQADLAALVGTSQSAIAKLEQGGSNPTINTLARCLDAAGFELRLGLVPHSAPDPVVEVYKLDVDRTLLRENLRKPIDERLRTLSEWQVSSREIQRAAREARRRT